MEKNQLDVQSQITCLYYRDLEPIARFYEDVMGFELVQEMVGWSKIYRIQPGAYLGLIDEKRGVYKAQEHNAVLLVLSVADAAAWYKYLKHKGVELRSELQEPSDIYVRRFFLNDPGGYGIEIEQFLNPETARIFAPTG